ncbi:hypothetical protein QUF79_07410 [Fictibacillus enclensis]|nr:hypothetical protein [Fictibacillus enclensis]MDM5197843.1 hypothetical protein [Fictibacillus enclensis]
MLIWGQSGLEKVMDELEIMNSNPFRYVVKEYGKNALYGMRK